MGRLLDLPEHPIGAIAGRFIGFVKRVNRRQAVVEHVNDADHLQFTERLANAGGSEFHNARVDTALQQELGVLVHAVVVHAAARVTRVLVAQIQRVMLWVVLQVEHAHAQIAVGLPSTALAAVGFECVDLHAQRLAGLAAIAVGAVGEQAAAPKTLLHQVRIHLVVDQVAGGGHLGTGRAIGQIAASIGGGRVELQGLQRKFFELAHWGGTDDANAVQLKD